MLIISSSLAPQESPELNPRTFEPALVKPRFLPELDPGFRPCGLVNIAFERMCQRVGSEDYVDIGLVRENGLCARERVLILPAHFGRDDLNVRIVENRLNTLAFTKGGWQPWLAGREEVITAVAEIWGPAGQRLAERKLLADGYLPHGQEFDVKLVGRDELPSAKDISAKIGGHTDGVRIGIDIGGSDIKVAIMVNGEVLFAEEFPWEESDLRWVPKNQNNFEEIYRRLMAKVQSAVALLKERGLEADAIGFSSAGIIVNDMAMVASWLNKATDPAKRNVFHRIVDDLNQGRKDRPIKMKALNDGEAAALAGARALSERRREQQSSEGAPVTVVAFPQGTNLGGGCYMGDSCPGYVNEFHFMPVDYNPSAPIEDWTKNPGRGTLYGSQWAVPTLAPRAGINFEANLSMPEQLKRLQTMITKGDRKDREAAAKVYETLGRYTGYMAGQVYSSYPFDALCVVGRIPAGPGGEIQLKYAQEVLAGGEFPGMEKVRVFTMPEEQCKTAQAIAACTLVDLHPETHQ
jgi:hypothetical protein